MRLIDVDELLKSPDVRKVTEYDEGGWGVNYNAVPVEVIKNAPTVDVAPVDAACWVSSAPDVLGIYERSKCGEPANSKTPFCPRCGRKMVKERKAK